MTTGCQAPKRAKTTTTTSTRPMTYEVIDVQLAPYRHIWSESWRGILSVNNQLNHMLFLTQTYHKDSEIVWITFIVILFFVLRIFLWKKKKISVIFWGEKFLDYFFFLFICIQGKQRISSPCSFSPPLRHPSHFNTLETAGKGQPVCYSFAMLTLNQCRRSAMWDEK